MVKEFREIPSGLKEVKCHIVMLSPGLPGAELCLPVTVRLRRGGQASQMGTVG